MAELTEAEAAAAAAREEEARRLRKARREAKIKAGAGDRLNRITGLASGVPRGKFWFSVVLFALCVHG